MMKNFLADLLIGRVAIFHRRIPLCLIQILPRLHLSALSELTEQFKLMRGDFVRFDGKLVTFGEKFNDMDDKISTMNNQVNNKIVDMDSRLTVLQDIVAEN